MADENSTEEQSGSASYRRMFWESFYARLAVILLTWSVGLISGIAILGFKAAGIQRLGRTPSTANITGCWSYRGPTYQGEIYFVDYGDREVIGSYALDRGSVRGAAQGLVRGIRDGGKGTVDFEMASGFHSDTTINIKGTLHQEWEAIELIVQSAQQVDLANAAAAPADLSRLPTIVASRGWREARCRFQERADP